MLYSSILFGLCLLTLLQTLHAELTKVGDIAPAHILETQKAYRNAHERLFFFDVDKILVGAAESIATFEELVTRLAKNGRNKVYIITARNPQAVYKRYGHIENVQVAGGMGMLIPTGYDLDGNMVTRAITPADVTKDVLNLHNELVKEAPNNGLDPNVFQLEPTGVLVNTKDSALYKKSQKIMSQAENAQFTFTNTGSYMTLNHREGHKGLAVNEFLEELHVSPKTFGIVVFSFGDSATDEPMHKVINTFGRKGFSIVVGNSLEQSIARNSLQNYLHVFDFVDTLIRRD